MILHIPDAVARFEVARHNVKRGDRGDDCIMRAFVPGVRSYQDCADAGWPEWLYGLVHFLFDARDGDECGDDDMRFVFAERVAEALAVPVDCDKARDLFLIERVETGNRAMIKILRGFAGDLENQVDATERVAGFLHRRAEGDASDTTNIAVAVASAVHRISECEDGCDDQNDHADAEFAMDGVAYAFDLQAAHDHLQSEVKWGGVDEIGSAGDADVAMRSVYGIFDDDLNNIVMVRQELLSSLRKAIARRVLPHTF